MTESDVHVRMSYSIWAIPFQNWMFRRSVETRIMLSRETTKQEQVLLSVLPKHIAHEVRI